MSAYNPGFVQRIGNGTVKATTSITPTQIKQYEPVIAAGEIVFAGTPVDIVMAASSTVNLSVATVVS